MSNPLSNSKPNPKQDLKYESISINKDGIELVLEKGQQAIQNLAQLFIEFMRAYEAPNFLELKVNSEEGEHLTVTIQKQEGQTPGDQISLLKQRIEQLEKTNEKEEL